MEYLPHNNPAKRQKASVFPAARTILDRHSASKETITPTVYLPKSTQNNILVAFWLTLD